MAMFDSSSELPEGVVVLRPDGIVEATHGAASTEWIGRRLQSIFDPASPARAIVQRLCDGASLAEHVATARVVESIGGRTISLIVALVSGIPLRPAMCRVDQVVLRVGDLFMSQARHARVSLDLHIEPDLPPVASFDEEKIAWSLSTLVGNALRHVAWKRDTDDDARVSIEVRFRASDACFVFRVSDNGPGMPEQESRWLFERNPATGKSAGLALMMVRDVMLAHRGSASVESEPGRGSTFTLVMPKR